LYLMGVGGEREGPRGSGAPSDVRCQACATLGSLRSPTHDATGGIVSGDGRLGAQTESHRVVCECGVCGAPRGSWGHLVWQPVPDQRIRPACHSSGKVCIDVERRDPTLDRIRGRSSSDAAMQQPLLNKNQPCHRGCERMDAKRRAGHCTPRQCGGLCRSVQKWHASAFGCKALLWAARASWLEASAQQSDHQGSRPNGGRLFGPIQLVTLEDYGRQTHSRQNCSDGLHKAPTGLYVTHTSKSVQVLLCTWPCPALPCSVRPCTALPCTASSRTYSEQRVAWATGCRRSTSRMLHDLTQCLSSHGSAPHSCCIPGRAHIVPHWTCVRMAHRRFLIDSSKAANKRLLAVVGWGGGLLTSTMSTHLPVSDGPPEVTKANHSEHHLHCDAAPQSHVLKGLPGFTTLNSKINAEEATHSLRILWTANKAQRLPPQMPRCLTC
jgi:hypothetical protein